MRISLAVVVLPLFLAGPAAADLYRWIDPETGSIKYSSYPPPWYDDPAQLGRAPRVQHIPAGSTAADLVPGSKDPAKPLPEAGATVRTPANSSLEERRKLLLKQISERVANLPAAKPGEGAQIYSDLAEQIREYNSAERFLKQVDSGGEAARRAEWSAVVAGLEGRRRKMLEQLSAVRVPAEGTPPDRVRDAWQELSRQQTSFGWFDNALKLFDPRGEPARETEQAALFEKIMSQWKPFLDTNPRQRIP